MQAANKNLKSYRGLDIHFFQKDYCGIPAGTWVAASRNSESWLDHVIRIDPSPDAFDQLLKAIDRYRAENPMQRNPWELPRSTQSKTVELFPVPKPAA